MEEVDWDKPNNTCGKPKIGNNYEKGKKVLNIAKIICQTIKM